ncbi:MAG: ABC transporter permease [Gammaproteobacteria bacterium]|nr:MAG: ABC transporter permease [Gammaproteobacteria bacterium]UCH41991.1 MAG: ABC transporter permease [Gammaproteobacteria bacterium]
MPGAWQSLWRSLKRVLREPLGALGLVLVVFVIVSAVGADLFAPFEPNKIDIRAKLQPPSAEHLLGTDQLGRDIFSRVLIGGQIALKVSLVSIGLALVIGLTLGLIAGFGPRWLDNALMLLFDSVRSFPTVMFALAVVTLFGPSLTTVMIVVVITQIPIYGRMVRSQTLALRDAEFILAERALGAGFFRIIGMHILPNVVGPLLILASMDIPFVITIEAGLSFLGMGVRPPTPSWGTILNDGYSYIYNTPWPVIAGGIPVILTTLGFTFLGESLRDVFDPRLRKEI